MKGSVAFWYLCSHHQEAVVSRGRQAWGKIKLTATEQRQLWREVGEALLVGRRKHKSDKLFGQWVKENGFGDMDRFDRHGAMWLADNWQLVVEHGVPPAISHPRRIREFLLKEPEVDWSVEIPSKQEETPEDFKDISISTKVVPDMDTRAAEKVSKLARRAAASCSS